MVLLKIDHHLCLHLSVLQYLYSNMDNTCPHCSKSCPNKNALKRHADLCEIKSSSAPARKSSRKTVHPDPVLPDLVQPDPVVLNQDSDLEKVLPSSCPFTQRVFIYYILFDWFYNDLIKTGITSARSTALRTRLLFPFSTTASSLSLYHVPRKNSALMS